MSFVCWKAREIAAEKVVVLPIATDSGKLESVARQHRNAIIDALNAHDVECDPSDRIELGDCVLALTLFPSGEATDVYVEFSGPAGKTHTWQYTLSDPTKEVHQPFRSRKTKELRRATREIAEFIYEHGGKVHIHNQRDFDVPPEKTTTHYGAEFIDRVRDLPVGVLDIQHVYFPPGSKVSGATLRQLDGLLHLQGLYLSDCDVTDSDVAHLAATHPQLRYLDLTRTNLTVAGIAALCVLDRLGMLSVSECSRIEFPRALAPLALYPALKYLELRKYKRDEPIDLGPLVELAKELPDGRELIVDLLDSNVDKRQVAELKKVAEVRP